MAAALLDVPGQGGLLLHRGQGYADASRVGPENRAELLAVDLKNGTFDPTKEKYRLFPKPEVVQKVAEPRRIDDLWELYRKRHLSCPRAFQR
ncbi:hypothetical protein [Leptolyngbya sp. BL0902]|uniref:hypothetical protein n=1 Tax=Leptolyngbya sp. BL0902 TaxID=1115757 RepID=UPI0018E80EA7|nr:hypothetical protein [Leptolyngbya sp. BL0902]